MDYPFTNQLLYIKKNVINILLRNTNAEPFKIPVNPETLHIPQYPKIIKCAMDFGTIKTKLDKKMYQTANECKSDFLDVFRNCYIFNEPGSMYVEMALKLENLYKRKMSELPIPEIYVPESAVQISKSSKKNKSKPFTIIKSKSGMTPINNTSVIKATPTSAAQKRSKPSSTSFKDEPILKKTKIGIDSKICSHILQNLMSKKYNEYNRYFLEPVDVEGLKLHDYYDIVKNPMDLSTVKSKLLNDIYQTNSEFAEDIRIIFRNCYLYNPEGHEVHRCGKTLESVFNKLYQTAFCVSRPGFTKSNRHIGNCEDLQPLLQKILKRQSEIDSLHSEIMKRYCEIQQTIEHINGNELIKSFKNITTCNNRNPGLLSRRLPQQKNFVKTEQKVSLNNDKPKSPKLPPLSKPTIKEAKIENPIRKISPELLVIPQPSPKIAQAKPENTKESSSLQSLSVKSQTPRPMNDTKPSGKPASKQFPPSDTEMVLKPYLNNDIPLTSAENKVYSMDKDSQMMDVAQKTSVKPISNENESVVDKKIAKNNEEFNSRLRAIKTWIGSQSVEMSMKIREFINKSEKANVVSVNLLKLKPITINGLYKMMTLAEESSKESENNIRDFSNEDRMQLSQDLRILNEKYSIKILNIYKRTENVESNDGEFELDFQKMKLVTLHRLREFADKYLQKRQPVEDNEDSDSDSSDSSETDGSDSNSDVSSSTSSENDMVQDNSNIDDSTAIRGTNPITVIGLSNDVDIIPTSEHISSQNVTSSRPDSFHDHQPSSSTQPISSEKPAHSVTISAEQSRLSDSSESGDDDNEVDSTTKRPKYTTFWSKQSTLESKTVTSTPLFKTKTSAQDHHSIINNYQLDESLRQIVQDAQASENVKKHEEHLRQVRIREEEEHKKQQILKMQALNENRRKMQHNEHQKKIQEQTKLKERIVSDQRQRNMEIPLAAEREDFHQILCDFEYNIDQDLLKKLVHLDPRQLPL